jgi:SAM-dependent methyltransferase
MTPKQFKAAAETLSAKANVLNDMHGYFRQHASRLHRSCELFGLFQGGLGDVLEIGPFYAYTPFVLRPRASSYRVLEGDDPAVYPLVPLYKEAAVDFSPIDFFELFGPTHSATHKLPFPDATFDTILCWETMEHFNFNPVKFVRELKRVLKPGGRVCITVPNRASFQALFSLMHGRGDGAGVNSYFKFEDYESNGKKAFYGFHWREYTPGELAAVFAGAGFKVRHCGSFTAFQERENLGFARRVARSLSRLGTRVLPRFGTNVYLSATT